MSRGLEKHGVLNVRMEPEAVLVHEGAFVIRSGAVAPNLQNGVASDAVAPNLQNGVASDAVAPNLQNGVASHAVAPGAAQATASMCLIM